MSVQMTEIISVDDHVVEPPDLWVRWLPTKFRDRGPKVISAPYQMLPESEVDPINRANGNAFRPVAEGPVTDWWSYEEELAATLIGQASAGLAPEDVVPGPISFEQMRPGCYDVKARLQDMTLNHIERSLCFPTFCRFAGQRFLGARDQALALACIRAYNDWMVDEWCGDSGGRLIPLCIVPLWDSALAAEEVRRNAARGVRAVTFSELPASQGLPSIHDPGGYWDPLLAECNDSGTVLCMHIGSSGRGQVTSKDAPLFVSMSLTTVASQLAMADWLLSGLLIRFPRLKLAFSESQIGWMPFLWERLDNLWRKHNYTEAWNPLITEPPSQYVRGHIWGCFFEDDFGVRNRDVIGVENITFECDYPHQDSTWPNTQAYAERVLADLSSPERTEILRGNAVELFGLPAELGDRVRTRQVV
jgi:predicted TIM-barrel fold metal-dependent hydrolase